jgi:hypothetical protein
MHVPSKPLRCLYYPYSRAISTTTLKKAVLLFDEIAFLDSQPWFVRRELLQDTEKPTDPGIEDEYNFLESENLVKIVNPESLIAKFDRLLTAAVINDIRDEELCKIGVNYSVAVWDVLRERIPPSFLDAFYPGAGTFSEAISLQAIVNAGGSIENISSEYRRFAEFRWKNRPVEELWPVFLDRYRWVVGGNPHIELEAYQIPFLQASSLRINEALLVAASDQFIPVTDSAVHDRMLRQKVERSIHSLIEDPELREKLQVQISCQLPYEHLMVAVLDRLIPDHELEKRTIKELVEYRRANGDKLQQMRLAVGSLAAELKEISPSPSYLSTVKNLVESKVISEITRAREEMVKEYEGAFGKLFLQCAQVTLPVLVATLFGGLSTWEIFGACALAESTFLATNGSQHVLDLWRANRVAGRNSYSYLTGLSD